MRYFVIALLTGIVFIGLGAYENIKYANLGANGVTAQGTVVNQEMSGSRRRRTYKVTVNFTPEGKSPIAVPIQVTSKYYNETAYGHTCKVVYLPNDPTTVIIPEGSSDMKWLLWVGLVLAVVGGGGVGYGMMRKSQTAEA